MITHRWGRVEISTVPTTVTSQIPKDWRMPLYLAASLNLFVFPPVSIRIPQEHACFLQESSGNEGFVYMFPIGRAKDQTYLERI